MKSIVIYYSETKNTEKVAKAIAEATGSEIKRVEEAQPDELADYDLIFIGTPVHAFGPNKKISDFLDKLPQLDDKRVAGFCTMHGAGDKKTFNAIKERVEKKGMEFLGGFSCLGHSRLVGNFGPRIFNKNRPDEEELNKAVEFAKSLLTSS